MPISLLFDNFRHTYRAFQYLLTDFSDFFRHIRKPLPPRPTPRCPPRHENLIDLRTFRGFCRYFRPDLAIFALNGFAVVLSEAIRKNDTIRAISPTIGTNSSRKADFSASLAAQSRPRLFLVQKLVLRTAIGTLGRTALSHGQVHLGMRIPEIHPRHRTRQGQVTAAYLVAVLRVSWNQMLLDIACSCLHGSFLWLISRTRCCGL